MTIQEYLLQQFIIATFKEMGVKFLDNETKTDNTLETIKETLEEECFKNEILDEFSEILIKKFGINY